MITLEPKTHGGTTVPNGKRGTESGHMLKEMIYILWCSYILKGMPIGYSVKFYWDLWGNE